MVSKSEMLSQLKSLYPYKVELHAHTSPVSPCGDLEPEEVVRDYKQLGYDALVITNHFFLSLFKDRHGKQTKDEALKFYLNDYYRARAEGERLGIKIILAVELRFPINDNDYLVFGVDESNIGEIYDLAATDIKEFYGKFKSPDSFILQAHPFRNGIELIAPEYLDGYEGLNLHPNHNSRVALAVKQAKMNGKVFTAGTDFHHPGHQGLAAMRFATLPEDSFALARALHENNFIFDICGSIMLP